VLVPAETPEQWQAVEESLAKGFTAVDAQRVENELAPFPHDIVSLVLLIETPKVVLELEQFPVPSAFFDLDAVTELSLRLSKADCQAVIAAYVAKGIIPKSPFVSVDPSVRRLLSMGVEGLSGGRRQLGAVLEGLQDYGSVAFLRGIGCTSVVAAADSLFMLRIARGKALAVPGGELPEDTETIVWPGEKPPPPPPESETEPAPDGDAPAENPEAREGEGEAGENEAAPEASGEPAGEADSPETGDDGTGTESYDGAG